MTLFRTNGTDSDSGSSSEASTSSHFSTSEDEIGLEDLKAFSNIDSHLQPTTSTENNVTVIPQIHRLIQLRKLVEGNSYCSLLVELKKIKKCATIETGLLFRLIEDLELKFGISSTKALRKSLTSDDAAALLKLEQLLKLRPEWMNGVVQKCKIVN